MNTVKQWSTAAQIQRNVDAHHAEFASMKVERDRLRAVNADLIAMLKDAANADEFYRHETARSAYLREFAERARAAIARAKDKGE